MVAFGHLSVRIWPDLDQAIFELTESPLGQFLFVPNGRSKTRQYRFLTILFVINEQGLLMPNVFVSSNKKTWLPPGGLLGLVSTETFLGR